VEHGEAKLHGDGITKEERRNLRWEMVEMAWWGPLLEEVL